MDSKKPKLMMGGHTDEIYTPKEAVEYLIPFLDKSKVIWDCAFETGKLKEYFEEEGFKIIGNKDINFLKDGQHCKEFGEMDIIITNPPYTIKDKFLEKAFSLGFPFALLLPKRYGLQLIIPNKRINYITLNGGKSSWFHSAWFCCGLNLPEQLNFVELSSLKHNNSKESKHLNKLKTGQMDVSKHPDSSPLDSSLPHNKEKRI